MRPKKYPRTQRPRRPKKPPKKRGSWATLPYTALVEIFKHLSDADRVETAQVCRTWGNAFKHPTLWRSRTFELGGPRAKASGESALKFVESLGSYLRHVRVTCRHITSNSCEAITSTLEPLAKSLENARLELLEIAGLELDLFWKHAHLRGKVADCLIKLIKCQRILKVFEMSSAQFGQQPGLDILATLAEASGPRLCLLSLEDFFHSRLAVFQLDQFRTIMEKFMNLSHVALNYCCLCKELLEHWTVSLRGRLKSLRLKACDNEPHAHVIPDETWTSLLSACPDLTVDLSIVGIHPAPSVIPILASHAPVISLHIWSGYDNDSEMQLSAVLNHISLHYCQRLQHLSIDFDNFHDDIDEALIRIIARCRNLTSVRVKANASVQVANAICQMVRERQNKLNTVNITLCDISVPDIEQLRDLQEEMQPFVDERGINLMLLDNLF